MVADLGDLDVVHLVVRGPAKFLRLDMFGMGPPGALAFLMLELDDGHPLAVIGPEPLVRDVSGNAPGDLLHAVDQGDVLVLEARHQARAEYGDDHDGLLRRISVLRWVASFKSIFAMDAIA